MWDIWIDVGGTFTDCLARSPSGEVRQFKTLSSGSTPGRIEAQLADNEYADPRRAEDPDGFWVGFQLTTGQSAECVTVEAFDGQRGVFRLSAPIRCQDAAGKPVRYQLDSRWPAPVLAVRYLTQTPVGHEVPKCRIRFGTTRGTNALLMKTGAKTVFVTTRGFSDILRIGDQTRPELFELNITKRPDLYDSVVEIDERLDAHGTVLLTPDDEAIRSQLIVARESGAEAVAICLMNAYANSAHEEIVEALARSVGFQFVSRSSAVSSTVRIVPRGETTVLDAYLSTELEDYLSDIQSQLPRCSIQLMTSTGGLVSADDFRGADSILSGPAGGVVGFAAVARQCEYRRAIGFDMGGTSTDVARWDHGFEYDRESMRAGVRIASPLLAIETVAAGGGSICGFDGQRLFVGPDSAGAEPGPACYGMGGPLTVTDLNVFLGRIVPGSFPFELDVGAVELRLREILELMPAGAVQSLQSLAQGLLAIAVDHMVQAIRRISVARGLQVSEYVLVCFGGAAGQLACTVARELGMERVLIHPLAGVLSAVGAGMADIRRIVQRSVLLPLTGHSLLEILPVVREMEQTARDDVARQGVSQPELIATVVSLGLRYSGTDSQLLITLQDQEDFEDHFAWGEALNTAHQRQFGFHRPASLVEIESLQVECVGRSDLERIPEITEVRESRQHPSAQHRIWFRDGRRDVRVLQRSDLRADQLIDDPAIICEPTSTVVIEPHCTANVLADGTIEVSVGRRDPQSAACAGGSTEPVVEEDQGNFDPVLLELLSNRFTSIAGRMGEALRRTSISTNVRERLDYSCALFDGDGNLVVNAPHIPVHLGAMSESVRCAAADFPHLRPGDVLATNDPRRGGSHLPDVTVVTPVFQRDGRRLVFFVASRAHHAEIGGIAPGSMPPFSRNLSEEGVVISGRLIVSNGKFLEDEVRSLLSAGRWPSRAIDENIADLTAQIAANAIGREQLLSLVDEYSVKTVLHSMRHLRQLASSHMRGALSRLPDGIHRFRDHLDDGSVIAVCVTIDEDRAVVDFSGTSEPLDTNLNANRAITLAAVLYVFRCLVGEKIPLNSGVLDPVELILPVSLLNPRFDEDPEKCPAVVGGNVETSQRIVDVLLGALELAAASQGTMNNLTFGDDSFGYYETICGGSGATADADGVDGVHTHMTNTRLTDPEILEQRYPIRVERFAVRTGSGGVGRHSGGDGIVRRLRILQPLTVSMLSQRHGEYPPFGLRGGSPGKIGENHLIRASGGDEPEDLGGIFSRQLGPGDILEIKTPGGGGFGRRVDRIGP